MEPGPFSATGSVEIAINRLCAAAPQNGILSDDPFPGHHGLASLAEQIYPKEDGIIGFEAKQMEQRGHQIDLPNRTLNFPARNAPGTSDQHQNPIASR